MVDDTRRGLVKNAVVGADRLGRVVEDAAAEGFELGLQRLGLGKREAHRGALAVAAQHREPVPVQRGTRRLDEPDVLGDVAGPQQPVLADQGNLALLLRG